MKVIMKSRIEGLRNKANEKSLNEGENVPSPEGFSIKKII